MPDGEGVIVTRQRGDWRKISVSERALSGLHLTYTTGGANARLPYAMLAAYMSCADIPDGADFGHSCEHGPPPHQIKVLIQQADNPRGLYRRLRGEAEARGRRRARLVLGQRDAPGGA